MRNYRGVKDVGQNRSRMHSTIVVLDRERGRKREREREREIERERERERERENLERCGYEKTIAS